MAAGHQGVLPLVCLVTNAATGIGRAVAAQLAQEGGRLVLVSAHSADKDTLEQVGRHCANIGAPSVDIHAHPAKDKAKIVFMAHTALSRQGVVDVIVNCPPDLVSSATLTEKGPKSAKGEAEDEEQDLLALPMELARAMLPTMLERQADPKYRAKRAIINIIQEEGVVHIIGRETGKTAPADTNSLSRAFEEWGLVLHDELQKEHITVLNIMIPRQDNPLGPDACDPLALEVAKGTLLPFTTPEGELPAEIHVTAEGHGAPEAGQEVPATPPQQQEQKRKFMAAEETGRMGSGGDEGSEVTKSAAAASVAGSAGNAQVAMQQQALAAQLDPEATQLGRDPGPNPQGTCRAADPKKALWLLVDEPVGGIDEKTGARKPPGVLLRTQAPDELGKAAENKPGAVQTPADPDNLEVGEQSFYKADPKRNPNYIVHCFMPFNGETPHRLLADKFITPADLFYVRNHLPVPERPDPQSYRVLFEGVGISVPLQLSLNDLQSGRYGPTVKKMVTLECAGNRRNEMAAIKLVTGRAPWNHGSIGNAEWEGVLLRDVLAKAGLNVEDPDPKAKHVVIEGLDFHHTTQKRFEISIPIRKAVDKLGHTMLAWKMNGEELLPDHGYPLRVIVPGYVGTRSVKWLSRITVSESESQSAWQQKDYKILPPKYHSLEDADFSVVPPIMAMNTQSAILIPEPGSTVPQGTEALWVKGYAWCGAGLPIIRVDVSVDRGITWEMADIVEQQEEATDLTWAWCKWQIPIKVRPSVLAHGGKWSICCKAFNRNCDTQPSTVESIWNFRGLATNAWHYVDLRVEAPTTTHKS